MSEDSLTSMHALLVCAVMILTLTVGFVIEHSGIQVVQEAGTALLIGLGGGGAIALYQAGVDTAEGEGIFPAGNQTGDNHVSFLHFDNDVFFNFILPPIIFSAGYTMRKRKFFQNFGTIVLLGVAGTSAPACTHSWTPAAAADVLIPANLVTSTSLRRHDCDCGWDIGVPVRTSKGYPWPVLWAHSGRRRATRQKSPRRLRLRDTGNHIV